MRFFYTILLILGAILLAPHLAFAAPELPSECFGDSYEITVVGDNNFDPIDTGNGKDCVLVGDNNSGSIDSGNGGDIIVVGNNNTGNINGGTGVDIIIVGYDNSGNILGGNGADIIKIGYGNTGTINGENGPDVIVNIPRVPSATPVSGSYTSIQHITLTSDGAASIHYTTDGTAPDCSSNTYAELVSVFSTKTIKAVGCSADGGVSAVVTFTYTIELKTDPADLSSILEAVFTPATGSSLSLTQSLTLSQDLEINTTASGSKIVLDESTVITRADGQDLNATALASSETDIGSLAGLTEGQVFEAALQWGIPNITLEFNPAITISIFVGTDLNGKTLDIVRSVDGTGGWTNDGIVSPTCTVSAGICSFQATKASYYATYTYTPPAQTSNSGGGGGTIWFPALYNPVSTTTPSTTTPEAVPVPEDIKPVESPVLVPSAPDSTNSPKATPVIKTALAPKPKVSAPKETVVAVEIVAAAPVPEKTSRPFIFSLLASMGCLLSSPFSFLK